MAYQRKSCHLPNKELEKPFVLHSKVQRDCILQTDLYNRSERKIIAAFHPSYGVGYIAAASELFGNSICSRKSYARDEYISRNWGDENHYYALKANERMDVVEFSEGERETVSDEDH